MSGHISGRNAQNLALLQAFKLQRKNIQTSEINREKIQSVSLPITGTFDMKTLAAFWTRGLRVTGCMS